MRLLIVEDDVRLALVMKRMLEEDKHFVDLAHDGASGLERGLDQTYDVIVLDLMLPNVGGIEICKRLREAQNDTPILILTARDGVQARVQGLDAGADDYVTKPFAFAELAARLRALGRRRLPREKEVLRVADLSLDLQGHLVSRAGQPVDLTPREFDLLEYLMLHPGQVLTRHQIVDRVWGYASEATESVVDTYVHYLRKKVDRGFKQKLIRTVRGFGYKIGDQS